MTADSTFFAPLARLQTAEEHPEHGQEHHRHARRRSSRRTPRRRAGPHSTSAGRRAARRRRHRRRRRRVGVASLGGRGRDLRATRGWIATRTAARTSSTGTTAPNTARRQHQQQQGAGRAADRDRDDRAAQERAQRVQLVPVGVRPGDRAGQDAERAGHVGDDRVQPDRQQRRERDQGPGSDHGVHAARDEPGRQHGGGLQRAHGRAVWQPADVPHALVCVSERSRHPPEVGTRTQVRGSSLPCPP